MTTTLERIPFGGDLINYARDYAAEQAESLSDSEQFPTVLHVVSSEECTTVPMEIEGLELPELHAMAAMLSRLVSASDVAWVALQTPIWMDITGDVAALIANPKPHPLVSEGLALLVIDAEGADFHVAEVKRNERVSLSRWHETQQGPCCDANGVCS